jgi:hypothetical protein
VLIFKSADVFKKLIKSIQQRFFRILFVFQITTTDQHHPVGIYIEQAFLGSGAAVSAFPDQLLWIHSAGSD